ncbi:MAG: Sir2 family NAD-dependent protein deacetylase [bacterium]
MERPDVHALRAALARSRRLLIFTGAGISVDSGIPDFRSPGGIWARLDPFSLSVDCLEGGAAGRATFWRTMVALADSLGHPQPNASHRAVADLERRGQVILVVTQNVDGLHQAAGSDPRAVVELHGNTEVSYCVRCKERWPTAAIVARVKAGEPGPLCDCGGLIRPELVVFGDPLPPGALEAAFTAARTCDACLVLGSSLSVTPAAHVPLAAKRAGARLLIVTKGSTPLDDRADLKLDAALADVFVPAVAGLG